MLDDAIETFLEQSHIPYQLIRHVPAYTAQETAAAAHVKGREFAKTVIIKADGEFSMAVLSAAERINFDALRRITGARQVTLAGEEELDARFPEFERGALPPFGNFYNLSVYVSPTLARDENIVFNAGSHTKLVRISFRDFFHLVHPMVAEFTH